MNKPISLIENKPIEEFNMSTRTLYGHLFEVVLPESEVREVASIEFTGIFDPPIEFIDDSQIVPIKPCEKK